MAANKTQALANRILAHFLEATASAEPATVYAALFTVAPTATDFGTEVLTAGGTAYDRVNCGATSVGGKFAATLNVSANDGPVVFPTAAAAWGEVVAVAILTIATPGDTTAGSMLYFGTLLAPKTVDSGDTVTFATGALEITET